MLESCCKLCRFFLDVLSKLFEALLQFVRTLAGILFSTLAGSLLKFGWIFCRHSVGTFWRFDVVEFQLEFARIILDFWRHLERHSLEIGGTFDWNLVGIWLEFLWNLGGSLLDFR